MSTPPEIPDTLPEDLGEDLEIVDEVTRVVMGRVPESATTPAVRRNIEQETRWLMRLMFKRIGPIAVAITGWDDDTNRRVAEALKGYHDNVVLPALQFLAIELGVARAQMAMLAHMRPPADG